MARINGIEGKTAWQLADEVKRGGKFVAFQYVVSVLVMSFRRSSEIYYLPPGESVAAKSLPWTLLTLALGWWGFPWGFIWTPMAVFKNLNGGIDVTEEVMAELMVASAGEPEPATNPASLDPGIVQVTGKRTVQLTDRVACLVTFTAAGQPMELEVPQDWYQYLNPGDSGVVTLQENQFWGFQKI